MTPRQVFQNTIVVIITFVATYVLWMGARILLDLLVAIIIASALRPLVIRLERHKVPPALAILGVYTLLIFIVLGTMGLVLPSMFGDASYYIANDSQLTEHILTVQTNLEKGIESITQKDVELLSDGKVESIVQGLNKSLHKSFPNILTNFSTILGEIVIIVVMGAYWLASRTRAVAFITQLFSSQYRIKVENIIDEIDFSLGSYVRGVVSVGFLIGFLNFVILTVAGVPNAAQLGLVIGVATTIPMIGGFLGGVLAVLMTLVVSPEHVPVVAATAFFMQLVESYYISPALMSRLVNLDPLLVMVYLFIGFILFGIVGALIAVPAMRTIHILLNHLIINPHKSNIRMFRIENGLIIMNNPIQESMQEGVIEVASS